MRKAMYLLVLILVLSACQNGQQTTTQAPPQTTGTPSVEPQKTQTPQQTVVTQPVPPAPAIQETAPSRNISAMLKKTLALADSKVKSYEFYYAPPPDNLARDKYFVKGDKIHVAGYKINVVRQSDYYDSVYIDTTKKTAVGFCESADARCKVRNKRFDLDYKEVMIKLPYQWLKEIEYGDIAGSESLESRTTKKVVYEKDGITYSQWLDEFSGLPLKVQADDGKKVLEYDFKDLAINSVDDWSLVAPDER